MPLYSWLSTHTYLRGCGFYILSFYSFMWPYTPCHHCLLSPVLCRPYRITSILKFPMFWFYVKSFTGDHRTCMLMLLGIGAVGIMTSKCMHSSGHPLSIQAQYAAYASRAQHQISERQECQLQMFWPDNVSDSLLCMCWLGTAPAALLLCIGHAPRGGKKAAKGKDWGHTQKK